MEHGERGTVGRQVEPVLPRPGARWPPIVEHVQRGPYGLDGFVEHLEQANVVHG